MNSCNVRLAPVTETLPEARMKTGTSMLTKEERRAVPEASTEIVQADCTAIAGSVVDSSAIATGDADFSARWRHAAGTLDADRSGLPSGSHTPPLSQPILDSSTA
jgi:hypothetical protein